MEEYTREQIQRADDTGFICFFLEREQFKRCGKEYRWLRHSVMINKNEWYRFSQNKGGHAIDFMKEFYWSFFCRAVKELEKRELEHNQQKNGEEKEDAADRRSGPSPCLDLNYRKKCESCEIARKHLIEQRNYRMLIDQMIARGIFMKVKLSMWYSSEETKKQNPRYAAMRGTDENRCRGRQEVRKSLWIWPYRNG